MIKKFLVSAGAALITGLLFLYIVEWHFHTPMHGGAEGKTYSWGHVVKTNRFGFRERDFATPKPHGVYRIMVLGDSFTEGTGLAEEERYTDILEARLNSSRKRRFEVLNFGRSGYTTVDERNDLTAYKKEVDPDQIIVGFCFNDMSRLYYGKKRVQIETALGPYQAFAVDMMRRAGLRLSAKLLVDGFYRMLEVVGYLPEWREALDEMYNTSSQEWLDFIQALKDIRRMSDQMNLPAPIFAVLNHAMYADRPAAYNRPEKRLIQYLKWCHQAEEAAKTVGFVTVNYEQEIANELSDQVLAVNKFDNHPSAALHRLYARKLEPLVVSNMKREHGPKT